MRLCQAVESSIPDRQAKANQGVGEGLFGAVVVAGQTSDAGQPLLLAQLDEYFNTDCSGCAPESAP